MKQGNQLSFAASPSFTAGATSASRSFAINALTEVMDPSPVERAHIFRSLVDAPWVCAQAGPRYYRGGLGCDGEVG